MTMRHQDPVPLQVESLLQRQREVTVAISPHNIEGTISHGLDMDVIALSIAQMANHIRFHPFYGLINILPVPMTVTYNQNAHILPFYLPAFDSAFYFMKDRSL